MNILVTGAAGFIGYHTAQRLLGQGRRVVGIDNLNSSYDPGIKRTRLSRLTVHPRFRFLEFDLSHRSAIEPLFARESFDLVIHLAAQVGARQPPACTDANVTGSWNVLEGCRHGKVPRLIYASSSVTKRANELMVDSYTHLYGFAATGLRFFTVYGPWGRPGTATFRFAEAMERGARIDIDNYGRMLRDFTYIDDIVEGLVRVVDRPQTGHQLYNIGNGSPVRLMDLVHAMERAFGKRARRRFMPLQAGDVLSAHADVEAFCEYTQFRPATPLEEGVERFVHWYRSYYGHTSRARVA